MESIYRKITDIWPTLIQQDDSQQEGADNEGDPEDEVLPDTEAPIEETFKNLRWTRVTSVRYFEEGTTRAYSMVDDILEA